VVVSPFVTAVFALSVVNVFAVAELIREALADFPRSYSVAARVCGIPTIKIVTAIQMPIITRRILPSLLGIQVGMLQASLFASLISVDEIFRVCQRINAEVYRPVEIYTALALVFLIVCAPLHGLARWLKWRFSRFADV
jgi:ABC-type amino acid transport system permease subunit